MQKIITFVKSNSIFSRFIKFGFIGLTGTAVNSAVLWILHTHMSMSIFYASPLAIAIAIFNNFTWNDRFTWNTNRENRQNKYLQRLWKYYFSASLGAFLNYSVLLILTLVFGWYYLVSNLAGILAGMVSNFLLGEFWVFKNKK